jgi:hypothetical protein
MTLPLIDEVTIVEKSFGQRGIALDPSGGVKFDENGMYILPAPYGGFIDGVPTVTVGGTAVGPHNAAAIEAAYRREDRLVTVYFTWYRVGNYAINEGSSPVYGNILVSLPFTASSPVKAHANAMLQDASTLDYARFVNLASSTTLQVVDGSMVIVSDTVPYNFLEGDSIAFIAQYFCDASSSYLWS